MRLCSEICSITSQITSSRRETFVISDQKFDEFDRARVIQAMEEVLGIKLATRRGSKLLSDQNGTLYLVVGGRGDWHGIPPEMMADIRRRPDGKLIVASRGRELIRIYCAPLEALLRAVDRLTINHRGQHQFDLGWRDGHPFIKNVPGVRLELRTTIEYSAQAKEDDRREKEVRKLLSKLSKEQVAELLMRYKGEHPNG